MKGAIKDHVLCLHGVCPAFINTSGTICNKTHHAFRKDANGVFYCVRCEMVSEFQPGGHTR